MMNGFIRNVQQHDKAILKKMFVCSNATDSQNLPLLKSFFHGLDKKNFFFESENYALCFVFVLLKVNRRNKM
jgi:hypothetical protein